MFFHKCIIGITHMNEIRTNAPYVTHKINETSALANIVLNLAYFIISVCQSAIKESDYISLL